MWRPSEFHAVGTLRDWQSKDRIGLIDVPTLLVSGRYDEADDAALPCASSAMLPERRSLQDRLSSGDSPGADDAERDDRYCKE